MVIDDYGDREERGRECGYGRKKKRTMISEMI